MVEFFSPKELWKEKVMYGFSNGEKNCKDIVKVVDLLVFCMWEDREFFFLNFIVRV